MALKPCRQCGQQIATDAKVCPHCGTAKPGKSFHARRGLLLVIVLLVAVVLVARQVGPATEETPMPPAIVSVPEGSVGRCAFNPSDDRRVGRITAVRGEQVVVSLPAGGTVTMTYPRYVRIGDC